MNVQVYSFCALACISLTGLLIAQTYPQWWLDQGVVLAQPPAAPSEPGYDFAVYDAWMTDNYAVANLGQAKNLAAAAFNAMDTLQNGSAAAVVENMVYGFSTAPEDNYVPLTIGQLKALSAPFYDVMHSRHFAVILSDGNTVAAGSYPWAKDVSSDNFGVANLGQLKHVFSFDLSDWPGNLAPIVTAGEDQEILLPAGRLNLRAIAEDPDQRPEALSLNWTFVSGPSGVTFDDSSQAETGVDFSAQGEYVLRITASDGALSVFDDITVIVSADTDYNGIDDSIDAAWADLLANDPTFVARVNPEFYDPYGVLLGDAQDATDDLSFLPVRPSGLDGVETLQWDYDGDGISNYQEYLNGTSPTDFFNGETPELSIFWGNHQTAAPESFAAKSLYVKVDAAAGNAIFSAPVRFAVSNGAGHLAPVKSTSRLNLFYVQRTNFAGARVYFYTSDLASGSASTTVTASLPTGENVSFILTTDADYVEPLRPPYDFRKKENSNGTVTYTWRTDNPVGDFYVQREQPIRSGNWVQLFSVPYSSLEAPTDRNRYTVTVDSNYNVVSP